MTNKKLTCYNDFVHNLAILHINNVWSLGIISVRFHDYLHMCIKVISKHGSEWRACLFIRINAHVA